VTSALATPVPGAGVAVPRGRCGNRRSHAACRERARQPLHSRNLATGNGNITQAVALGAAGLLSVRRR
jgi:hypothetical protein